MSGFVYIASGFAVVKLVAYAGLSDYLVRMVIGLAVLVVEGFG